jgi:hypothetical protein
MGIDQKLLDLFPDTNKYLKKLIKEFRCNKGKAYFKTTSELRTAVTDYCNDPDKWKNNPMFNTYG